MAAVQWRFLSTLTRKRGRQQAKSDEQATADGHLVLREGIDWKLSYPHARGHRSPHPFGADPHDRDRQLLAAAIPHYLVLHGAHAGTGVHRAAPPAHPESATAPHRA